MPGLFSDIAGAVNGTIDTMVNAGTSISNAVLGWQNFQYQKDLQKQIFAREDNAVQRRVADLVAAGLSPTLAAGSAANAGQVVKTDAPQIDYKSNLLGMYQMMQAISRMKADISKTDAETDYIKAQRNLLDKEASLKDAQIQNLQSQSSYTSARRDIATWDAQYYRDVNLPSTVAGWPAIIAQAIQVLKGEGGLFGSSGVIQSKLDAAGTAMANEVEELAPVIDKAVQEFREAHPDIVEGGKTFLDAFGERGPVLWLVDKIKSLMKGGEK